jgi:tRNA 5-methylaminomethyl-2-thiouridine biosynthesis bifunctional protein
MNSPEPGPTPITLDGFQPHPGLVFDETGAPVDPDFGDVFRSRAGAWQESGFVFLDGCELQHRWRARERFTVLELGFGLGVNFLACLSRWQSDPARPRQLDFISIEARPLSHDDLRKGLEALLGARPGLAELLDKWPLRVPGLHLLRFESGSVTLTLAFGDVRRMLARLAVGVDAFFLDGFAPARNPQMWEPGLLRSLGRLARPGAMLATWSTATAIRQSLAEAGFEVERLQGFSGKRHRLRARWAPRGSSWPAPQQVSAPAARNVIIVGAGLAGTALAEGFARRGFEVQLIDQDRAGAGAGSGQPALADHPHLSPDDNPLARLSRAALLMRRAFHGHDGAPLAGQRCGRLLLESDQPERDSHTAMLARLRVPDAFVRQVDPQQASDLSGIALERGGLWLPLCATIEPSAALRGVIARYPESIRRVSSQRVEALQRVESGWTALDAGGRTIATAPVAILANAGDAVRLAGLPMLPLRRIRGQTTWLQDPALERLRTVVSAQAYLMPAASGDTRLLLGASFDEGESLGPDPRDDLGNLRRLANTIGGDSGRWAGRVVSAATGFRYTLPDRLPAIGPMPDPVAVNAIADQLIRNDRLPIPSAPGLYGAFGFGSRGLLWATLAAELLPAIVCGDPSPIERDLLEAISPSRYLRRSLRRGRRR